jgi:hypothetical protein
LEWELVLTGETVITIILMMSHALILCSGFSLRQRYTIEFLIDAKNYLEITEGIFE